MSEEYKEGLFAGIALCCFINIAIYMVNAIIRVGKKSK
jgi:hypothetical protein